MKHISEPILLTGQLPENTYKPLVLSHFRVAFYILPFENRKLSTTTAFSATAPCLLALQKLNSDPAQLTDPLHTKLYSSSITLTVSDKNQRNNDLYMDIIRTSITLLFASIIATGCSADGREPSSAEYCRNGGLSTDYTCDTENQVPDRKMIDVKALPSTDEAWMKGKLEEIKTWLQQEPSRKVNQNRQLSAATSQNIAVRNPSATDPELMRIEMMSHNNNHRAAMSAINSYLASNPDNLEGTLTKSLVLNNMGQFKEAEALLKHTIARHPNSPELYNNLAVLYSEQGDYGRAIETLLKAFSTHPTYAQVHQNLRELYATVASQAYNRSLDNNENKHTPQLVMLRRTSDNNAPRLNYQPSTVISGDAHASNQTATPDSTPPHMKQLIKEAIDHLNIWAAAWTQQNVNDYVKTYVPGFQPLNGLSNKEWQAESKKRLTTPSLIRVKLHKISVNIINSDTAKVTFSKIYQSNTDNQTVDQQMLLTRVNNTWRIKEERSF